MKTKNLKKKLVLSKTTVSNLQNVEMKAVHGGTYPTEISWCGIGMTECRKCPVIIPESNNENC